MDKDKIQVKFEDSSTAVLDRDAILPSGSDSPDWSRLQFNAYELILPTESEDIEIPWTTIRLLSDSAFAVHWAQQAEAQAKDIGPRLRELRQSKNLSSKEVAERAGITPQSLSRIEKGHHDVVFTTLRKILAAMGCSLQDLASTDVVPNTFSSLLKRLENAGIKRDWLIERFLPSGFEQETQRNNLLNQLISMISKMYQWSPEEILGSDPLFIDTKLIPEIKFKKQTKLLTKEIQAYTFYAHYISLLVLQAINHTKTKDLPKSPNEMRKEILNIYGPINLENTLRYTWDHGIPVIPLSDPGVFHGACWKISDRKVIVLKQLTKFQGRWLFDLSHELGHVVRHLDSLGSVIEDEEISPLNDEDIEEEANDFASEFLFSSRESDLAEVAAERAKNKVEGLRSAAIQIAAEERLPLDIFANYIAFRLSATSDINWWGTANNLQVSEPSAREIARKVFDEKTNLELLNEEDRGLILRAIEN
jgi:transcriptional regulator with XRE-family HTH domain/Zn-dependent peptidase ImmA (M78 family)